MTSSRLSKNDWIQAGFKALSEAGPGALRAEAIARRLNTTKGSFYWHFKDVTAYKHELLEHWHRVRYDDVVQQLNDFAEGRAKILALLKIAADSKNSVDEFATEQAIREWARHDESAEAVVTRVDKARVEFLSAQFARMGIPDRTYASALYASYIGVRALAKSLNTTPEGELALILESLVKQSKHT